MKSRLAASLYVVLVLVLAAFTGTALAGNGSGGGSDHSNGQTPTSHPASTPRPAPPTQSSKHEDKQSSTSSSRPATGGDNSHGVKPSSTTKHDTYAKASSDQTKQYGNGKTAGQIATQAGQPDATLHGPGNSQPHKTNCGGHEVDVHALKHKGSKCATSTSTPAAKAEQKKADQSKGDAHAAKRDEHAAEQDTHKSEQSKNEGQKTETPAVSADSHLHVTICHATGSSSNPYVRISPSASGVFHGHLGHQDGRDIVPPFSYKGQTYSENWDTAGQALYNAGCAVASTQSSGTSGATKETESGDSTPCGTTTQTVTEQVLVGVKHMIGPKGSGRYVVIHPSEHSAHLTGKHADDVPIYQTVTKTITVPMTGANCQTPQLPAAAVPATQASATAAPATAAPAAAAPAAVAPTQAAPAPVAAGQVAPAATPVAGAVKGAQYTLKPTAKPKPAGGVLGATTRLGSTVTSARLPFTGLPLWIFVAVAAALILVGVSVRRAAAEHDRF